MRVDSMRSVGLALLGALALGGIGAASARAADGQGDPTFGTGGTALFDVGFGEYPGAPVDACSSRRGGEPAVTPEVRSGRVRVYGVRPLARRRSVAVSGVDMDVRQNTTVEFAARVLVINGGSSSGKSSIARAVQELLPGRWLALGTDDLIDALPCRGDGPRSGITYRADGSVLVNDDFRAGETAWYRDLAAMVCAGARMIIEEVLLSGGGGQERVAAALDGLRPVWIGVRRDPRTQWPPG